MMEGFNYSLLENHLVRKPAAEHAPRFLHELVDEVRLIEDAVGVDWRRPTDDVTVEARFIDEKGCVIIADYSALIMDIRSGWTRWFNYRPGKLGGFRSKKADEVPFIVCRLAELDVDHLGWKIESLQAASYPELMRFYECVNKDGRAILDKAEYPGVVESLSWTRRGSW